MGHYVIEIVPPESANTQEFETFLEHRIVPEIPVNSSDINSLGIQKVTRRLFKIESDEAPIPRYLLLAFEPQNELEPDVSYLVNFDATVKELTDLTAALGYPGTAYHLFDEVSLAEVI
jgi:hypothetical protein